MLVHIYRTDHYTEQMLQQGTERKLLVSQTYLCQMAKSLPTCAPRDKAGYTMLHYFCGERPESPWELAAFSSNEVNTCAPVF